MVWGEGGMVIGDYSVVHSEQAAFSNGRTSQSLPACLPDRLRLGFRRGTRAGVEPTGLAARCDPDVPSDLIARASGTELLSQAGTLLASAFVHRGSE